MSGSRMLSSRIIYTFRSALPVAVAFFQSCFQQTLRLDRPVFGSLRLAPFFPRSLGSFLHVRQLLRVRHQLVDSTSRGPAVPVCPARLPDVSLSPAMTCAMLRALVVGNQELLQLPLITGCLRDDCDETFLPPSPSPHPALSRRRSRANNLQHASTIYHRGITQGMVQVQHGLVHVT